MDILGQSVEIEVSEIKQRKWQKMYVSYQYLPKKEKDKDRIYADKILKILKTRKIL